MPLNTKYKFLDIDFIDEKNEEIKCVTNPPKKNNLNEELAGLELKEPTDQTILKSIQESCERQELLLNKALKQLASQQTQMNKLALTVADFERARIEEAIQAAISSNLPQLDKEKAETTSTTIETKENGKQMTKTISTKQKKLLWVRYTLVVNREGKSISYPLLLCLGQCQRIGPHSRNYLSLMGYDFITTETTVMLVLKPSPTIYKGLKQTYGLELESLQSYDLAKQGLKYWQLIGDKQLLYQEDYATSDQYISSDHVSPDQDL